MKCEVDDILQKSFESAWSSISTSIYTLTRQNKTATSDINYNLNFCRQIQLPINALSSLNHPIVKLGMISPTSSNLVQEAALPDLFSGGIGFESYPGHQQ
jgi:hypothetical protein